jgi:hypothetical protein
MVKDITGFKFNKLTVIEYSHKKGRVHYWVCKCECGKQFSKSTSDINRSAKSSWSSCRTCSQQKNKSKDLGESSWRHLYNSYKNGADKRNLQFELNMETFKSICKNNCFYCGKPPREFNRYHSNKTESIAKISKFTKDRAWVSANGIDRIDPTKGYILNNVVTCCSICNYIKLDLQKEDFLNQIKNIYEHLGL